MARRLPPLNALRALEAAGRHGSFTRAAVELHVTPGAVSRQIKVLEDFLGIQLFDRTSGTLSLTDKSAEYVATLTDVFGRMEIATRRLLDSQRDRRLHISCTMTVTMRWLVPRLPSFHSRFPQWELSLTTAIPTPMPVVGDDADLTIRLDEGNWPDMITHRLFNCELVPVCSPKLLENGPPLRTPSDFAKHTLLHSQLRPYNWPVWLSAAKANGVDPESGISFGSSTLSYQAAKEGLGVAVIAIQLVLDDLRSGQLVAPFDLAVRDRDFFNVVYDRGRIPQKTLEFRDWILEEAAATEAEVQKFSGHFKRLDMSH